MFVSFCLFVFLRFLRDYSDKGAHLVFHWCLYNYHLYVAVDYSVNLVCQLTQKIISSVCEVSVSKFQSSYLLFYQFVFSLGVIFFYVLCKIVCYKQCLVDLNLSLCSNRDLFNCKIDRKIFFM